MNLDGRRFRKNFGKLVVVALAEAVDGAVGVGARPAGRIGVCGPLSSGPSWRSTLAWGGGSCALALAPENFQRFASACRDINGLPDLLSG